MPTQQELDVQAALTAGDEAARQRQIAAARARDYKPPEPSGLPDVTETGEPTVSEIKSQVGFTPRDTSELERLRTAGTTAVDEAAIRKEEQERIKAQIEAIQRQANVERQVLAQEAQERTGRTRAVGARAGLAGSTFGEAQAQKTGIFNQQQREAFEAQIAAQIAAVQAGASDRAAKEIEAQRLLKSKDYDRFLEERNRIQTAAREDIAGLGAQGATLDDLDSATKDLLLKQSGMSEFAASTVMMANNPQANAKYQVIGNKVVGYYFDPKSGTIKTVESEDLPGVADGDELQVIDGVPYVMSRGEDGKISGEILPGFEGTADKDTSVQTVGGQKLLIDNQTGDTIKVLGSSTKGGSGGTSTDTTKTGSEFDNARQFIIDNPDASDDELKQAMQEYTDLSISEINSLVKTRTNIVAESGVYNADETASYLYENFSNKEAMEEIEGYDLTPEQKEELKTKLQEQRTRFQKFLPFGK